MRVPERKRTAYTWRWAAALGTLAVLAVGLVVWLTATPSPDVHAANFTVDSTGDTADASPGDGDCEDAGGDCTLRAAIQEANASGVPDSISFNIFGAGPHVITLGSVLPDITDDDLTIDGGAEVIQLLVSGAFDGLRIDADNVTIRDLILDGNGQSGYGIRILANNDDIVIDPVEIKDFDGLGIHFVSNNDGNLVDAAHIHDNTATGILVGSDCDDNTIQNSTIEDNGTTSGQGIVLDDGSGNQVTGNTIEDNGNGGGDNGIAANSQADLLISNNTISDNFDNQIWIGGNTGVVTVKNNLIDVDSDGIELDSTCGDCSDVAINGGSDSEANTFSGPLGADEYYLENMSSERVDATHNDWAGDSDPSDKICGRDGADDVDETPCDGGGANPAGSEVDWDPVAPSGVGGLATPTPTVTNTPMVTPTVTGTPPTATPSGTPPTGTPTAPAGEETVPLVAGCQFEPWTGAAAVNPTDLAARVSPTENIRGLWAQQPPPTWKGYNPSFPDASDMGPVDTLDVVAFCMSDAATLTRPLI